MRLPGGDIQFLFSNPPLNQPDRQTAKQLPDFGQLLFADFLDQTQRLDIFFLH
jgi:hypothetical protein